MGTLRGDNGGDRPPDNGGTPEPIPNLPPEWGVIVIPDDPSELADEVAQVRRQLRRGVRRNRWRRRLHLSVRPERLVDDDRPALAVPLIIMAIAVIATLTSLFAVTWPTHSRLPAFTPTTASAGTTAPSTLSTGPSGASNGAQSRPDGRKTLPDITLTDLAGKAVRLRMGKPSVIMLIDGCRCTDMLASVEAVCAPPVELLAVASEPPFAATVPTGTRLRVLIDRTEQVRAVAAAEPPGPDRAIVLLVNADATLVRVADANNVADFRSDLNRLGC
jgi:hypothetical protein